MAEDERSSSLDVGNRLAEIRASWRAGRYSEAIEYERMLYQDVTALQRRVDELTKELQELGGGAAAVVEVGRDGVAVLISPFELGGAAAGDLDAEMSQPRPTENHAPFDALRRREANLPHLLDVAVQILRDKGLFAVYEEVLYEDWEAARNDAD